MAENQAEPSHNGRYQEVFRHAMNEPQAFWSDAASALLWDRPWQQVLDSSRPPFYRWFSGGALNTCRNALDRHVEAGRGSQPALIYDSPVTGRGESFSFEELTDRVARFADVLIRLGVEKGDRVLIYMPMIPESVIAMLACARIGAIHSVVFGGFAAKELATRIDDATPKLILTASCGIEPSRVVAYQPLMEEALQIASHSPVACVVLQREERAWQMVAGRDHDWRELVAAADRAEPVLVEATDPLYILYTSGTTGKPKGVVRDHGGHAVALHWSLENVYGMQPGDVFWAASDIGWVVGHSYIVYAPLLLGCTTILYEGKPVGTPDAGAFWRVASQHGVNALFTAPTAFRAIKREDPDAELPSKYDLSELRTLFLAGERADPDTVAWSERALEVPVIDHWWQTETGWPIAANCMGIEPMPVKHGSPTVAVPGYDIRVLSDDGSELPCPAASAPDSSNPDSSDREESGHIVVKLPLPPGCLTTLWNDEEGFQRAYLETFPGYYQTADAGYVDADGYVWIMSRTDDIINVAGHRLSTGGMEAVLSDHPEVAECAVIGVADKLKGQVPVGLVVLNRGCQRDHAEVVAELIQRVRERIGPVASFKQACVVAALPKTRSGKTLRGTIRKIADAESYALPATIDDPAVLDQIEVALRAIGLAR